MKDFLAALIQAYLIKRRGGARLAHALFKSQPLVPEAVYGQGRKLNLGSGGVNLPGYVNLDVLGQRHPDVVSRVERLPFGDGQAFDLVRASHILEHFPPQQCPEVLAEWRRVIKPGGYLVICVPDFIRQSWLAVLDRGRLDPNSPRYNRDMIGGHFALDLPPEFRHQSMFSQESLTVILEAAGFKVLGRQSPFLEQPYLLGLYDDSCSLTSLNLVARRPV